MKRILKNWSAIGLSCALLSLSSQADAVLASVKALGTAGATVAYAQDALSPVYNPALGMHICDRWDFGVNVKYWKQDAEIRGEQFKSARHYVVFPEFGINWRCDCNWSFGLAIYNWDYWKTHYRTALTDFGTSKARFDYHVEVLQLRTSHRINRCNSLGLSLDIYGGRFRLDGFERFDTQGSAVGTSSVAGHVNNNGYDYTSGYGWTVGWLWSPESCWDIGVSYSPRVSMRQLDRYKGFLSAHAIDIPATFRIGTAYRWGCDLTFLFDFEYLRWSQVRAVKRAFPGDSAGGTRDGWGFQWRDQWKIKTGLEYRFDNCITARVGYRYEKPVHKNKSAGTYLNVLTVRPIEHYLSWGLTYKLDYCSELSFVNEWGLSKKLNGTIPTVTTPAITTGDFALKSYTVLFGLSYGRKF